MQLASWVRIHNGKIRKAKQIAISDILHNTHDVGLDIDTRGYNADIYTMYPSIQRILSMGKREMKEKIVRKGERGWYGDNKTNSVKKKPFSWKRSHILTEQNKKSQIKGLQASFST